MVEHYQQFLLLLTLLLRLYIYILTRTTILIFKHVEPVIN